MFLWLFLGNILWFVPFGFLLPLLIERHRFVKTMLAGLMFSLAIETLQFVFYKGVAEIDDLILNSLGVLIGFCLCKLFNKFIVNRGIIKPVSGN
jgi:glycopeptide antibiotics resistance protein